MKNIIKLWGIIAIAVIGLSVIGCGEKEGGALGTPAYLSPFAGTWTGTIQSMPVTFTMTDSTWSMAASALGINQTGTYVYTGNAALIADAFGDNIGTATIAGGSLTVSLNSNLSFPAGTYGPFIKANSVNPLPQNSFDGTWTGTVQGTAATITISGSTWVFSVPFAGMSEYGTYTYSNATAILLYNTSSTVIGSAILTGNILTVSLNQNAGSYAGMGGIFTKTGTSVDPSPSLPQNLFNGTWTGLVSGDVATITFTGDTWSLDIGLFGDRLYETGTYTSSGNTATLYDYRGFNIGTVTYNTAILSLTMNQNAESIAGRTGVFYSTGSAIE